MPLALILRARTTALVILNTLGMVLTVKVRLFFCHAFYRFRVGIGWTDIFLNQLLIYKLR